MEQFNGMSRDTLREKIQPGMWQLARNILIEKGASSIKNEYGFDKVSNIPGKIIGVISTTKETVFISVDNNYTLIGYINNNDTTYINVLRTQYLKLKKNRPVEGVFYYDYTGDLIIVFSDGVYEDSNTPKLINVTNLGLTLDANNELVNPDQVVTLDLFPSVIEAEIDVKYGEELSIPLNVVYLSYSYLLPDGKSSTGYFPIQMLAYSSFSWNENKHRAVLIKLKGLDTRYNKLKIGFIINGEDGLQGYETNPISYSGTSFEYTISSLSNNIEVAPDSIIIPNLNYNRIGTITTVNNEVVIGNLAISSYENLQKYVNNLELEIFLNIKDDKDTYTEPTLLPDEVYAIYIQPQLKSGEYTNAYPLIPKGVIPVISLELMTLPRLQAMGLDEVTPNTYKRFHIENDAKWFNNTIINYNDKNSRKLEFGTWVNEEEYPNNEHFQNIIGNTWETKNIRYFRIPGLDVITEKIPSLIGINHKQIPDTSITTRPKYGVIPRFDLEINNFNTVIPANILNDIQGYKLLIVKRTEGNRIVETNCFSKSYKHSNNKLNDGESYGNTISHNLLRSIKAVGAYNHNYMVETEGLSILYDTTLMLLKPAISSKIVKCNYGLIEQLHPYGKGEGVAGNFDYEDNQNNNIGLYRDNNPNSIGLVKPINDSEKYAYVNAYSYNPAHNITASNLYSTEKVLATFNNTKSTNTQVIANNKKRQHRWNPFLWYGNNEDLLGALYRRLDYNTLNYIQLNHNGEGSNYGDYTTAYYNLYNPFLLNITLINLIKTLHQGFNPTEFITIKKVNLLNTDEGRSVKGDIFTNNIWQQPVLINITNGHTPLVRTILMQQLFLKGNYSIYNNVSIYKSKYFGYGALMSFGSAWFGFNNNYSFDRLYYKEYMRKLNDLIQVLTNNSIVDNQFYFPYRIARSNKIQTENIKTDNVRIFKTNAYYDMINNRGEIVALRGTNKQLFIQQRFSLFTATIKDRLNSNDTTTYLGEGDLFDRTPDEIRYNENKGYVGSGSKFSCIIIPKGYIVIDNVKGNIFLVGEEGFNELSAVFMDNYFEEDFLLEGYKEVNRNKEVVQIDNPFTQIGYLTGFDEKNNRLLVTRKSYDFKYKDNTVEYEYKNGYYYIKNGNIEIDYRNLNYFIETSKTFSYSFDMNKWISEHDYFPSAYYNNQNGLYSVAREIQYQIYKHNSFKVNRGLFYNNELFEAYVDLVFNGTININKIYQAITWQSVVKTLDDRTMYDKTIDKIMIYGDYQCSGILDVKEFGGVRNKEGIWNFNNFRDMVIDESSPILNRLTGTLYQNNLNFNKSYFDKRNIFGIFIVVRLVMSSKIEDIYINSVNVKSIKAER